MTTFEMRVNVRDPLLRDRLELCGAESVRLKVRDEWWRGTTFVKIEGEKDAVTQSVERVSRVVESYVDRNGSRPRAGPKGRVMALPQKRNEVLGCLAALAALALWLPVYALWGVVLRQLWAWHLGDWWGKAPSTGAAVGAVVFVAGLRAAILGSRREKDKTHEFESLTFLLTSLVGALIFLLWGWLLTLFR